MEVLQKERKNGKVADATFVVDGHGNVTIDGTVTPTNGGRRDRRGYYVAIADVGLKFCVRARTRDDAEEDVRGWVNHIATFANVAADDVVIKVVPKDVDVGSRVTRLGGRALRRRHRAARSAEGAALRMRRTARSWPTPLLLVPARTAPGTRREPGRRA